MRRVLRWRSLIAASVTSRPQVSKKSDLNKFGSGGSRILYAQSWVNDGNGTLDVYGHGTNVAGILASNGYNSTGSQFYADVQGNGTQRQHRELARSRRKRRRHRQFRDFRHRYGDPSKEQIQHPCDQSVARPLIRKPHEDPRVLQDSDGYGDRLDHTDVVLFLEGRHTMAKSRKCRCLRRFRLERADSRCWRWCHSLNVCVNCDPVEL